MTTQTIATLRQYLYLSSIEQVGFITLKKCCESFACDFHQLSEVDHQSLLNYGFSSQQIACIKQSCQHAKARVDKALAWLQEGSLRDIICFNDPRYPASLKEITSPPLLLFCEGNIDLLQLPSLAIVGTRAPSQYAYDVIEMFLDEMRYCHMTTISGLALGVDAICHRASLANHIPSIAVLGNGLNQVYPKRHAKLYQALREKGLLISEFWPDEMPISRNFPRRNRIISGLCSALLVSEGRLKSGTLVTVNYALEHNKEILAIPSSIYNRNGELAHHLIKEGASPVRCASELLEIVPAFTSDRAIQQKSQKNCNQSLATNPLLDSVGDSATSVELIAKRTGMSVVDVLTQLLEYELRGLVASTAEGYVKLRG